jgi:hypothetical protein
VLRAAFAASLAALLLTACSEDAPAGHANAPGAETAASAKGWFVDRTAAWGVDFVHDAGLTPEKPLPETMGAGAALLDVDGDGDLDLYLVQGGPMRLGGEAPGTFRDPDGELPVNRLLRNDGGRFVDRTAASGDAADAGYGMGVCAGDVNGDGALDLYVTNLGPDVLLLGDGHGSFRDGTQAAGIADERWTAGATFFDADADGDLDLYVTAYLEIDMADPPYCGNREPGWRSVCHPDAFPGLGDRFWRNRGDGTFEDATAAAGLSDNLGKGLGVAPCDVEGDGDLDLYVANDSTENRLWLNDGNGHFEDGTLLSGTGVNGRGATEAGMGIASGDVDEDGELDLFVTNFDDESNTLYVGQSGGLFRDRTAVRHLEGPSRLPVGFGTVFADFDHDGDLDLAVANGHIVDNIHLYHDGKTHAQRAQLFENDGTGRFRELVDEAGDFTSEALIGRGLYSGDLDGDGDLDLVLTQCGGPARVYENVRPKSAGLILRGLAAGSRVEVRTNEGRRLVRDAGPQVSYFGQSSPHVHVGLPVDRIERVSVRALGGEARLVEVPLVSPVTDLR